MATDARGHTVPAGSDAFDPQGSDVALSLSINDIVYAANASDRTAKVAAIAPTTGAPVLILQVDTGVIYKHDGTTAVALGTIGDWATYTPTVSYASGAALPATVTAKWRLEGATRVRVRFIIVLTAAPTESGVRISLPVASAALPIALNPAGFGQAVDASGPQTVPLVALQTSTTVCALSYFPVSTGVSTDFSTTPPAGWTGGWAAGDGFVGEITYDTV